MPSSVLGSSIGRNLEMRDRGGEGEGGGSRGGGGKEGGWKIGRAVEENKEI